MDPCSYRLPHYRSLQTLILALCRACAQAINVTEDERSSVKVDDTDQPYPERQFGCIRGDDLVRAGRFFKSTARCAPTFGLIPIGFIPVIQPDRSLRSIIHRRLMRSVFREGRSHPISRPGTGGSTLAVKSARQAVMMDRLCRHVPDTDDARWASRLVWAGAGEAIRVIVSYRL